MKKGLFLTLFLLFILQGKNCYAEAVSSTELINNAKKYNDNIVVYRGEVIGDIMTRGDYAWININDGKNAIGIWLQKTMIQGIQYTGSYNAKGDFVEVRGVFHRSCPEHGGDIDIHAEEMIIIGYGNSVVHKINTKAATIALWLFCGTLLFYLLKRTLKIGKNSNYS